MQEVDRPAVYSRTGFPDNDPSYQRLRDYLWHHTEQKALWWGGPSEGGFPRDTVVDRHSESFDRRTETLHTPKGDLIRSFLISRTGEPGMYDSHYVGSPEDAEAFLSLPPADVETDPSQFFEVDAGVGEAGIAEVLLGSNPAGYVAELCGSENFALMTVTARDTLHRLCRRRMDELLRRVKFLIAHGVGPFFSMQGEEYLVPPLHGPADFDDFNVRYDKPIIDAVHDGGGHVHVHSHGRVRQVFGGFLTMGADVLHPCESPPQGDLLARDAKEMARGSMCIEGNIQINRMYECSPHEISEETATLIRDAFDDRRGLIVSPTASPYIRGAGEICLPRYVAMVETVLGTGD